VRSKARGTRGHAAQVTSAASRHKLSFTASAGHSELLSLIAAHSERIREPFFRSDKINMSPANGTVIVVQHNGLIAILHGPPDPRNSVRERPH
jgi:hypothetical protein